MMNVHRQASINWSNRQPNLCRDSAVCTVYPATINQRRLVELRQVKTLRFMQSVFLYTYEKKVAQQLAYHCLLPCYNKASLLAILTSISRLAVFVYSLSIIANYLQRILCAMKLF